MIAFSRMTLKEAIDEVFIRVGDARTSSNLDYGSVRRFVRDARREVFNQAVAYRGNEFVEEIALVDQANVPTGFISPVRCLYRETPGSGEFVEARRADPREWTAVADGVNARGNTGAESTQPVYMIWSAAPAADNAWAATMPSIWLWPAGGEAHLEYCAQYSDADVALDADSLRIPADTENLLINLVLQRVYAKLQDEGQLQRIFGEVQQALSNIERRRIAINAVSGIEPQAFPDPEPASTPSAGSDA